MVSEASVHYIAGKAEQRNSPHDGREQRERMLALMGFLHFPFYFMRPPN
jgi:hypothetical protein